MKSLASFTYYHGQHFTEVHLEGNGHAYQITTYQMESKPTVKKYRTYQEANEAFEHFFMNRHPRD